MEKLWGGELASKTKFDCKTKIWGQINHLHKQIAKQYIISQYKMVRNYKKKHFENGSKQIWQQNNYLGKKIIILHMQMTVQFSF